MALNALVLALPRRHWSIGTLIMHIFQICCKKCARRPVLKGLQINWRYVFVGHYPGSFFFFFFLGGHKKKKKKKKKLRKMVKLNKTR